MKRAKRRGPFVVRASREVYRNRWLRVREDRVRRPDGAPGLFGVIEMRSGSSVLPLFDDGTVLLTREYKYGLGRTSLEVVSGGRERGETFLAAAKRELREEAGCSARTWTDLGPFDSFTTVVRSPARLFLAAGLRPTASRRMASGEPMKLVRMPLDDAAAMVMRGRITHGASCTLILKAARWLPAHTSRRVR